MDEGSVEETVQFDRFTVVKGYGSDITDHNAVVGSVTGERMREGFAPQSQETVVTSENHGANIYLSEDIGASEAISNQRNKSKETAQTNPVKSGITIVDNKKRRTDNGLDQNNDNERDTELHLGLGYDVGSETSSGTDLR
ncbi:hypothetical protein POM88_009365 [Heracleum sosnowskyi]|uniref:Uncharacterized protein n=1 Tax=Heracleum sosnowskyi TaxID=360622 RepID=A0AAD8J883_9APIA|nr:hypothetical protein POM88_009365 [Heracleum sosnowskyi]